MSTVTLHGHGVYCYICDEVHESSDDCEHRLGKKAGVREERDGFVARSDDMGHNSPCRFMELNGRQQCPECNSVQIADEEVPA